MLYKRPRIDYRVSEYVFEYIKKHILEPRKWEIYYRPIDLSFVLLNNKDEQIDYCINSMSVFNSENTKYDHGITKYTGPAAGYRFLHLFCYSTEINENIKPKEYAHIVYDMIGAYLVRVYSYNKRKNITKELMDNYKTGMDYTYIESFKYPAAFENQKYYNDDYSPNDNGRNILYPDIDGIDIKKEYINKYGE
jgi:hypothetical protein